MLEELEKGGAWGRGQGAGGMGGGWGGVDILGQ